MMTREELIAKNKLERPYWTAEDFIATRILRAINASGGKAYTHLKGVLEQLFPGCNTATRWNTASWLLKRRIQLNLVVDNPLVIGMPASHKGKSPLDDHIRSSGYDNTPIGSRGPNFYIFRNIDTSCTVGYMVWDLSLIGYITPRLVVHPGNLASSRIVTQDLDTFLKEIEFSYIADELVL